MLRSSRLNLPLLTSPPLSLLRRSTAVRVSSGAAIRSLHRRSVAPACSNSTAVLTQRAFHSTTIQRAEATPTPAAAPSSAAPPARYVIYFGSQTGTANGLSHQLAKLLRKTTDMAGNKASVTVVDLANFSPQSAHNTHTRQCNHSQACRERMTVCSLCLTRVPLQFISFLSCPLSSLVQ